MSINESLQNQILLIRKELMSLREQYNFLLLENEMLKSENLKLTRQLNQDSSNSSKPPSSDPTWKRASRPSKTKGGKKSRKPGGQKGHPGHKLKKFDKVDYHQSHKLDSCPICQSKSLEVSEVINRQVVDIPEPKIEVTEHEIWKYKCGDCGNKVNGGTELNLTQEVQYGPRIKSLVNYLSVYQLIPYKRLTDLIMHLFGILISQGSISNFNKELQGNLKSFKEAIKKYFIEKQGVIHTDETECMVNKVLHWVHVYSDSTKTFLAGHMKRGKQAINDIGILTAAVGILIHDRFSSYTSYDQVDHGLCNSHILRDLTAIIDNEQLEWPQQIAKVLLKAKEKKDQKDLTKWQITRYVNIYETILGEQRSYYQDKENQIKNRPKNKGKPKRSQDHNLFKALWKHRTNVYRFITDKQVPFDNNQAERDFRMLKVKMKISCLFKSLDWLNVHVEIRSYISTAIKQELNVLDCIQMSYCDPDFSAKLAV